MKQLATGERSFSGIARDVLVESSASWVAAIRTLKADPEGSEAVHRVRGESRKLVGALRIFRPVLSGGSNRKKLGRTARKIRRALAPLHDAQVSLELLKTFQPHADSGEVLLFEELSIRLGRRVEKRGALVRASVEAWEVESFESQTAAVLKKLENTPGGDRERPILLALAGAFSDVLIAERDLRGSTPEPLHVLRRALKHALWVARYFAPERCELLDTQVQLLGEAQDLEKLRAVLSAYESELELEDRSRAAHAVANVARRIEARRQARYRAFIAANGGALAPDLLAPTQAELDART